MSLDKNAEGQEPQAKPPGSPDNFLALDFQDISVKPMPLGKFMRESEAQKTEQQPIMEPTPLLSESKQTPSLKTSQPQAGGDTPPPTPKPLPSSASGAVKPLSQRNAKPAPAHSPRTFTEKDHAAMKQHAKDEEERKQDAMAVKKGVSAPQQAASRLQVSSMGGMLQAARARANLSIPQVEDMTRIKKSYVESLEADDFDRLPPPVFISAYIRTLCNLYNISAEDMEIVQDKLKEVSTKHEVPETLIQNLEKDGQVNMAEEARVRKILIGLVCAIVLVALWATGWCLLIKFHRASEFAKATASVEASSNRQATQQPQTPAPPANPPLAANPNFDPAMLDRFIFPETPAMTELKMPGSASSQQQPAKKR